MKIFIRNSALALAAITGAMVAATAVLASPATADLAAGSSDVFRIWPGAAPGTPDWRGPEQKSTYTSGSVTINEVSNVTTPTLTVYRPKPGTANGTAVVVAPGGGFRVLEVQHEGEMVAQWLAERGVTAFVLKYRVRNQPELTFPTDQLAHPEHFGAFAAQFEPGRTYAVADGLQAIRYLRANASGLGIAPDRIGMIGFSAGAITTIDTVLDAEPVSRPNFAAVIYGAMIEAKPAPVNGPPLFIVAAQDDDLVPVSESVRIFDLWTQAHLPAELHVFQLGGHGFGMIKFGKPADGWTTAYEAWLKSGGWMAPSAPQ